MNPENYLSILKSFTSDDYTREALTTPFIQENLVFATDGHILVYFDKKLLGDIVIESHPKAPNALALVREKQNENQTQLIPVSFIKNAVEKCNQLDKETYESQDEKCPVCFGSGRVDYTFEDSFYQTHTLREDCPVCDASGWLKMIKNKQTGKAVYEYEKVIMFGKHQYKLKFISRILDVAKKLGVDDVNISYRSEKGQAIIKVGECNILMMAYLDDNKENIVVSLDAMLTENTAPAH